MSHKYFLTFPQDILDEPVLYTLGRDFQVVPNIRGASVSDDQALMAVELARNALTNRLRSPSWVSSCDSRPG